jgi:hypothetical protein
MVKRIDHGICTVLDFHDHEPCRNPELCHHGICTVLGFQQDFAHADD